MKLYVKSPNKNIINDVARRVIRNSISILISFIKLLCRLILISQTQATSDNNENNEIHFANQCLESFERKKSYRIKKKKQKLISFLCRAKKLSE